MASISATFRLPFFFFFLCAFVTLARSSISPDSPANSPSLPPQPPADESSPTPSPSPSPSPAPAVSISSPPAPPPSDLSQSSPSPSPHVADDEKPPSPAPAAGEGVSRGNQPNAADLEANESSSSGGMGGGQKAGVAIGVIAGACIVGAGALVYRKRQRNLRRSQYGYASRIEMQ